MTSDPRRSSIHQQYEAYRTGTTMEPIDVVAYDINWNREEFPLRKATVRPLRHLTDDAHAGIMIDVPRRHMPDIGVEIGVDTLLEVVQEAARMWYDDQGIDQPEYIDQPADDPGPTREDVYCCATCLAAEACAADGCEECADYLCTRDGCED